jgi:hypothetical protein
MTIDIRKEAAALAALIGEPMPHVHSEADLLEYADYVVDIIRERASFDEGEVLNLRIKLDPDRWWYERLRNIREQAARRGNRRALKAVQAMNAERKRRQGEETRARVLHEAERVTRLPERDRAGAIARRVGLSPRQVRRILTT